MITRVPEITLAKKIIQETTLVIIPVKKIIQDQVIIQETIPEIILEKKTILEITLGKKTILEITLAIIPGITLVRVRSQLSVAQNV